jgi:hypothetical protein
VILGLFGIGRNPRLFLSDTRARAEGQFLWQERCNCADAAATRTVCHYPCVWVRHCSS